METHSQDLSTNESLDHSDTSIHIPSGIQALTFAAIAACTYESPITNITYEIPPATTSSQFLGPEACGIQATIPASEMPPFAFYGKEADGVNLAILIEEEELKKANAEAANFDQGGWIQYVPGEDVMDTTTEPMATLCVSPANKSWTVCEPVSLKIAGGMTRVEWHGEGEGMLPEYITPSIPTLNLDLNQVSKDFEIQDTTTGRDIDNVRINSGQSLGLPSAAISYELSSRHGVMTVPTSYVHVTSNVWGIDENTGSCVSVPMLNVMRSNDGNICETNGKDLEGDCVYGFEGYSLSSLQTMECQWAKNGTTCDYEKLTAFADAVQTASTDPFQFSEAVAPYVDRDKVLSMIADEKVQYFGDGYAVGNNNVWDATQDSEGNIRFYPAPYSRDFAMVNGGDNAYIDFLGGEPIAIGWAWDPESCMVLHNRISELNEAMKTECAPVVEDHFARIEAHGMTRPQDEGVKAAKLRFCETFPGVLGSNLPTLEAHCASLLVTPEETGSSTETGF